jgi:putative transposase
VSGVGAQREAVQTLTSQGVSQRRACALVGIHRSSLRYQARSDRSADLAARISALAQQHPRYGYRRIGALLRREGRTVNPKRVRRLWQRARLQVRHARRRARRAGTSAARAPQQAQHPGHVWTYDFMQDATLGGRPLRLLTVLDEFTRECLAIAVATAMPATQVIAVLEPIFRAYGAPQYLRSDNGPEFIALDVRFWLRRQQTATLYIDPGCPWQNGYGESFNGTVRDECLNLQAFASVAEAQVQLDAFRRHYNEERPHSRLGYQTPVEFKRDWLARQPPSAGL